MPVCVKSEIGKLEKVLLRRPGRELEHLTPDTMAQLLFDDIPYLHGAQREHDQFAEILRSCGTEVVYLDDLVAETLAGSSDLKAQFIGDVLELAGSTAKGYAPELKAYLSDIHDTKELVQRTMEGVAFEDIFPSGQARLASMARSGTRFLLPPIPNLYFTRDPFACIGNGVSLNHMYSVTRNRETIYGSYVLRHHPDFAGSVPLYYEPSCNFNIEGGDILNLSPTVLAVGISQRTQPEAIELLAKNIFAQPEAEIDTILAFEIPNTRAFMHLDTVFTQVDVDKFTVHPGILDTLRLFELTGKGEKEIKIREMEAPLDQVLAHYLHLDSVQLIRCGGQCQVAAEREQWNDGSNTLCVAPGVVVVYDRNYVTNQILIDSGVTVLKMPSSELSRGRGGPRCMSMPLLRKPL